MELLGETLMNKENRVFVMQSVNVVTEIMDTQCWSYRSTYLYNITCKVAVDYGKYVNNPYSTVCNCGYCKHNCRCIDVQCTQYFENEIQNPHLSCYSTTLHVLWPS